MRNSRKLSLTAAASAAVLSVACGAANAVPVRDDFDFDAPPVLDTSTDVTGVGQMIVWNGDGTVGTCTGTLVNPRMVIFAAHCVNNRPDEAYGPGGTPMGFGFRADTLDGILDWLGTGFQTSRDEAFYNVIDLITHPDNFSFLEADVAIATLDTPASDLPTWKLLFSPLTSQPLVHSNGYGSTGDGTSGAVLSGNFQRRIANNQLGLLGSLDDIGNALFGAPSGLPQDLYFTDFDDPERASFFDFDIFPGDALDQEGLTGPGDSGGPLIVPYLYDSPVVAGVLSGGQTYFGGQPSGGYGATSFYQPLFLFSNWIAENNPYVYAVSSGDGAWEDAATWARAADPNLVVDDGQGGLAVFQPTTSADDPGVTGETPNVGEICFLGTNPVTGQPCEDAPLTGADPDRASLPESGGAATYDNAGVVDFSAYSPQGAAGAGAMTNGDTPERESAPFATNPPADGVVEPADVLFSEAGAFVPENAPFGTGSDPRARYYDVTIGHQVGLNSLITEVDRLSIIGGGLDIGAQGDLLVLVDTNVVGGVLNIDGLLLSQNILGYGGAITGDGAGFATNAIGVGNTVVAPGAVGEIGTLTLAGLGGVLFSDLAVLAIDLGAGGASDLLATTYQGLGGSVQLGGTLALNVVDGYVPQFGDSFEIVTGSNISGGFLSVTELPGVLFATPTIGSQSVSLEIEALAFSEVARFQSQSQAALANALSNARGQSYGALEDVYRQIDLLAGADLIGAFENLVPHEHYISRRAAAAQHDALAGALAGRLRGARGAAAAGTGEAAAQMAFNLAASGPDARMDGAGRMLMAQEGGRPLVRQLGDGAELFMAGGGIFADVKTTSQSQAADLDGYFGLVGIDLEVRPDTRAGVAVGYADTELDQSLALGGSNDAGSTTYSASAFVTYQPGAWFGSAALSYSSSETDTRRFVALGSGGLGVRADGVESTTVTLAADIGYEYAVSETVKLTPSAGISHDWIETDASAASGSTAAMAVESYEDQELTARAGVELRGDFRPAPGARVAPFLYAGIGYDLETPSQLINARFVAAPSVGSPLIAGVEREKDYGEVSAGLLIDFENGVGISATYDARFGTLPVEYETLTFGVRVPF